MIDIVIRPIIHGDLDMISGKCWENRDTQLRLLEEQEVLGMGAWHGTTCVGMLHAYSVTLPDWDDRHFPGYGRRRLEDWPLCWPLLAARAKGIRFARPVRGHACFHVGWVGPKADRQDSVYFGRGIGTALAEASIAWARGHGYAAILAHGGPKAAPAYNPWMGCLPWTTYARLGFETVAMEDDGHPQCTGSRHSGQGSG